MYMNAYLYCTMYSICTMYMYMYLVHCKWSKHLKYWRQMNIFALKCPGALNVLEHELIARLSRRDNLSVLLESRTLWHIYKMLSLDLHLYYPWCSDMFHISLFTWYRHLVDKFWGGRGYNFKRMQRFQKFQRFCIQWFFHCQYRRLFLLLASFICRLPD